MATRGVFYAVHVENEKGRIPVDVGAFQGKECNSHLN